MKKVLSLVLVLMLCLAMSAMAATSPDVSAIIANIAAITATATTETGAAMSIGPDVTDEAIDATEAQVKKLAGSTAEEFFGADAAAKIAELSSGKLVEMFPILCSGYDASMGAVTVSFDVPSAEALTAGQKTAVAIGVPNGMEAGEAVYDWTVLEGVADGNGAIVVTIDADTMAAISVAGAMVAIYA